MMMAPPAAHLRRGVNKIRSLAHTRSEDGVPMVKDDLPPNPQDWRELAQKIQEETDPEKLIELVRELIAKFDEDKLRKSMLAARKPQPGPGFPEP